MKLIASEMSGKAGFGSLAMVAESQAETYQLLGLNDALRNAGISIHEWDNMEGERGFTVFLKKVSPSTP